MHRDLIPNPNPDPLKGTHPKIYGKKYRKIFTYSSSKADNPSRIFGGSFSSRLPLNRLHYENDKKDLN